MITRRFFSERDFYLDMLDRDVGTKREQTNASHGEQEAVCCVSLVGGAGPLMSRADEHTSTNVHCVSQAQCSVLKKKSITSLFSLWQRWEGGEQVTLAFNE